MAFEPATVSPLRIQKSNSSASANSATSHYSNHSQHAHHARSQNNNDMRPKTPSFDHSSLNHFQDVDSSEIGTPESVIHYSFEDDAPGADSVFDESSFMPEPSYVPRRFATIKAPDGRLKTRTSHTVAELVALRDITQQSNEPAPPVSSTASALRSFDDDDNQLSKQSSETSLAKARSARRQSFRMKLDMPTLGENDGELGFGMDKEFDRLLGASKRGYQMRENDGIVVASTRDFSNENQPPEAILNGDAPPASTGKTLAPREIKSAGNSPRKASGPLTKEPWNGRMRRHSTRRSIIAPEKPMQTAPTGNGLDTIEDASFLDEQDSGAERGRFFVKVVAAKDLNIPLPRNERCHFQLTLDNGLHCVTTNTLELGRNAPIGQEFELTVFDDLDFSLTLQTKLERPTSKASTLSTEIEPSSPSKKSTKGSAFSRFLSSPKKRRREEEMKLEAEAQVARQRKKDLESRRATFEPCAWDLLHNLVGPDGSFAQSVISLEDHEQNAYGRPFTVDVPCFNNWAAADDNALAASTKSKHGGIQRKPPYKIGSLSLQMVYVPRPKGITDEDMPTSMSACIKQMKDAEAAIGKEHEGFLSQQGGDCPYWRRRLFRLTGSSLTSYHETTRQRRANINLTKATKLIDDRSSLTQSAEAGAGKKRRKSAFAADEEGYMFVEEGFRIRFANGEVIDFYAENRQQKEEWMTVLSEVLGRETNAKKPTWTNAVLAREKAEAAKAGKTRPSVPAKDASSARAGARSVPTSPAKTSARPQSALYEKRQSGLYEKRPASPTKQKEQPSPKRNSAGGLAHKRTSGVSPSRRQAVKSMIF